jgi:CheY-like chemotaxis protein
MKAKPCILVVDDNVVMLRFLTNLLTDKYSIETRPNAFEAIRWLQEGNHPSLIISDVMSYGMDNLSFIKNLRISGYYRDTPIVLFSSFLQTEDNAESTPAGVNACFTKPFNPIQLKETISQLIKEHEYAATA